MTSENAVQTDHRNITYAALEWAAPDLGAARRARAARIMDVGCSHAAAAAVGIGIWLGVEGMPAVAGFDFVVAALMLYSRHARRQGKAFAAHFFFVAIILSILVVNLLHGIGPGITQTTHLWFIPVAIGAYLMFPDNSRTANIYSAISLLLFALLQNLPVNVPGLAPAPAHMLPWLNLVVVASSLGISAYLLIIYSRDITRAEDQLTIANTRLEGILESMLPHSISTKLREEGRTFAEGFDQCSILFADIVGFTRIAESRSPEALVELLNSLFGDFDELCEYHRVEKIKTIGDAYMVAAGLPERRADHAVALIRFALAMLDVVSRYPDIQIRVGINSGPVVAGIIGRRRFIYDLWGDSVNLAQRIESGGSPGHISVSETTYRLARDDVHFSGPLYIKTKEGIDRIAYVVEGLVETAPRGVTEPATTV